MVLFVVGCNALGGEYYMVTITDVAAREIQAALEEEGLGDRGVRIYISGLGCSGFQYGFAIAEENESVDCIEVNGVKVYMDEEALASLEDSEIDLIELPDGGKGFVIKGPDMGMGCGPCDHCH